MRVVYSEGVAKVIAQHQAQQKGKGVLTKQDAKNVYAIACRIRFSF